MAHIQVIDHITACKISYQFSLFLFPDLSAVVAELITLPFFNLCFVVAFCSIPTWFYRNSSAITWYVFRTRLFCPPRCLDGVSVLCYPPVFTSLQHCLFRWFYPFPWLKILSRGCRLSDLHLHLRILPKFQRHTLRCLLQISAWINDKNRKLNMLKYWFYFLLIMYPLQLFPFQYVSPSCMQLPSLYSVRHCASKIYLNSHHSTQFLLLKMKSTTHSCLLCGNPAAPKLLSLLLFSSPYLSSAQWPEGLMMMDCKMSHP